METSKDLQADFNNAVSTFIKSCMGICAGGVLLLGSLLNTLITAPEKKVPLLIGTFFAVYICIIGIARGLYIQMIAIQNFKSKMATTNELIANMPISKYWWHLWLTVSIAFGSYGIVAILVYLN